MRREGTTTTRIPIENRATEIERSDRLDVPVHSTGNVLQLSVFRLLIALAGAGTIAPL